MSVCPKCEGRKGTSGSIPYEWARWRTPCDACNGTGLAVTNVTVESDTNPVPLIP